jgi:hypothetical protein
MRVTWNTCLHCASKMLSFGAFKRVIHTRILSTAMCRVKHHSNNACASNRSEVYQEIVLNYFYINTRQAVICMKQTVF